MNTLQDKVYLIATKWSFPFGGGEEFMYDTMKYAEALGMRAYWLSFSQPNNKPYSELSIEKHKYGTIIKVPGGFVPASYYNWLRLIKPDVVHHQGHLRRDFYEPTELLRIPFVSGFHFWSGGIILDETARNNNIIENADKHKTDPDLIYLKGKSNCYLYTASQFVSDAMEKITPYKFPDIIYAASSQERCRIPFHNIKEKKYVTMINIHKHKGGELLLYLINECPGVSFMGVRTEYQSEELDAAIRLAMDERNNSGGAPCIFMERVDDPKIIYRQTRIFLAPSNVDETFCRTVNETMMNGIPVITTGKGNIKYMTGNDYPYIHDFDDRVAWRDSVMKLYNNETELLATADMVKERYEQSNDRVAFKQFKGVIERAISQSKDNNVMIISVWAGTGLGNQSRTYRDILESVGYNVFIFAFNPYGKTCLDMQKNPDEWRAKHIYYSPHDREHIRDTELLEFIKKYNIGKAIMPETCYYRVFEIGRLMKQNNVKMYVMPNIEIVRKDEIYKHRYFHKILCNNKFCEKVFNNYGVMNTDYIGFGMIETPTMLKPKNLPKDRISFLTIGGYNALSRKNVLNICHAIDMSYQYYKNIHYTVTIQAFNALETEDIPKLEKYRDHPAITILQKSLTNTEIDELYHSHHISVLTSQREGLSLNHYHSSMFRTPAITFDQPPHCEIILDGVNGWLIPCGFSPMTDNGSPIYDNYTLDATILSNKINEICKDFDTIYPTMINSMINDYNTRMHVDYFTKRFVDSLQS